MNIPFFSKTANYLIFGLTVMKTKYLTVICLLILTFSAHAQTGEYVPQLANFDAAILNLMKNYNVSGGQLAISYQGRLVYNRGFGLANTETKVPVSPESRFRIASVSKTITSIACMKLFEQGLLDLDAKVFGSNGILNDAVYQNILDSRATSITVRMLLEHSGGWDSSKSGDPMFDAYKIATNMGVPSPPPATVTIQYMLSKKMLDFTPGTQSKYSNFGFSVLGRVIEKITGKTYENFVRNAILIPLGITDMQLGRNSLANQLPGEVNYYNYPNAPRTYSIYDNSTLVGWTYDAFNLEAMDSHGGWVSSSESLVKLLCAIDRFNTRPDILTNATIDRMTKPSVHDPNYAFGIGVNKYNNWWHLGSLPGTSSEIVRNGSGQLNWAILLNTRDKNLNINAAMDNLVWNVLPTIKSWPTHDLFLNTSTGVSDISANAELQLYPNPASEKLTISLQFTDQIILSVKIYNSTGQEVFTEQTPYTTKTIDISQFADGVYAIRAISDKQIAYVKKVIIKK